MLVSVVSPFKLAWANSTCPGCQVVKWLYEVFLRILLLTAYIVGSGCVSESCSARKLPRETLADGVTSKAGSRYGR